jgi:hypothetical protein
VPRQSQSALRDPLTALTLFLGSAAFTLWQNARVGVLWDLAYLLDSSFRIDLGQVPYRDFPFAHAPLTFLIQAAIIHLFGRVYWHVIVYAAIANGLALLLTWRIALRLMPGRRLLATLLCSTLVPLGIYSIYPHPIYDSDCILSVLLALYLLLRANPTTLPCATSIRGTIADGWDDAARPVGNALAGAACVLPLFFKQNIGLLFLLATLACIGIIAIARLLRRERIVAQLAFFLGAAATLAAALLTLHLTVGLHNYIFWTITFAAQRRLPGLSLILGIYHQASLLWTVPTSLAALLVLNLAKTLSSRPERSAVESGVPGERSWLAGVQRPASAITADFSSRPERAARSGETRIWDHLKSVISTGAQRIGERGPRRAFLARWGTETRIPSLRRWKQTLAFALLIAPFLYATLTFFLADDASDRTDALLSLWPHLLVLAAIFALFQLRRAPTLTTLFPLILLATIHGTFLSQQLWGSTYALWPLLVLLLAQMLGQPLSRVPTLAPPLTLAITAVFLVCGSLYALGLDRLSYNHLEGPLTHATLPSLRGLTTPGPYLPDFEQLIRVTDATIPANEGIILLPGQDPFYFATGRTPRFPVLLLDPATNPYSPAQIALEAVRRNIRWLIVNKDLQLTADPIGNLPNYVRTLEASGYRPVQSLDNYTLYRRTP